MASSSAIPMRSWTKDEHYLISTDPSLIPLDNLNSDIFGAEDFTWGKPLPAPQLKTLMDRSLCFGLYEIEHLETSAWPSRNTRNLHPTDSTQSNSPAHSRRRLIGFARLITDLVTVHYLTDVYILPAHRAQGLGVWLMQCINEVFTSTSHLRGMILITDRGSRTEEFYRKYLGMGELAGRGFCMDRKGRGG